MSVEMVAGAELFASFPLVFWHFLGVVVLSNLVVGSFLLLMMPFSFPNAILMNAVELL
jgi:hypothetical protein